MLTAVVVLPLADMSTSFYRYPITPRLELSIK